MMRGELVVLVIAASIVVVASHALVKPIIDCPPNEVYSTCAACEGSCANPNPACTRICRGPKCFCNPGAGFVRINGKCENIRQCRPKGPDVCEGFDCPAGTMCEQQDIKPCPNITEPCEQKPVCV